MFSNGISLIWMISKSIKEWTFPNSTDNKRAVEAYQAHDHPPPIPGIIEKSSGVCSLEVFELVFPEVLCASKRRNLYKMDVTNA